MRLWRLGAALSVGGRRQPGGHAAVGSTSSLPAVVEVRRGRVTRGGLGFRSPGRWSRVSAACSGRCVPWASVGPGSGSVEVAVTRSAGTAGASTGGAARGRESAAGTHGGSSRAIFERRGGREGCHSQGKQCWATALTQGGGALVEATHNCRLNPTAGADRLWRSEAPVGARGGLARIIHDF